MYSSWSLETIEGGIMDAFFDNAPAILAAASKSPLGTISLMALALSIISIIWFHSASAKIKVLIFLFLFVGMALFVYSMMPMIKEKNVDSLQKNIPQVIDTLDKPGVLNSSIQKQCIEENPSLECLWIQ